MRRVIFFALLATSASLPMTALANLELAKKSACLACHAVDKKILGPAYIDIAKRYAVQKDAEAKVIESIAKGSSGKWGSIPMQARGGNTALSDADIRTLTKWILGNSQ